MQADFDMTPEEEEAFIFNQYYTALNVLTMQKNKVAEERAKQAEMEARVDEYKQAMIDFMKGNGIVSSEVCDHKLSLSKSYAVEIENIEAVPDDYIRIKREPDKSKIKGERPVGNWYTIKESDKLTVRSKV